MMLITVIFSIVEIPIFLQIDLENKFNSNENIRGLSKKYMYQ